MKTVLTIAGLDPTSGAGVQSDILTIYQHGAYPLSIPTAVTGQNAHGVHFRRDFSIEDVIEPLRILFQTHTPDAIKIGMVGTLELQQQVYTFLSCLPSRPPIIMDPIMVASSGKKLMDDDSIAYFKTTFLQLATLVTPNLSEWEILFGDSYDFTASSFSVLKKGGHATDHANDILYENDGTHTVYKQHRIHAPHDHGTGCTLSSAIASNLALGHSLKDSVAKAKAYLLNGLSNPIIFENGHGAIRK